MNGIKAPEPDVRECGGTLQERRIELDELASIEDTSGDLEAVGFAGNARGAGNLDDRELARVQARPTREVALECVGLAFSYGKLDKSRCIGIDDSLSGQNGLPRAPRSPSSGR